MFARTELKRGCTTTTTNESVMKQLVFEAKTLDEITSSSIKITIIQNKSSYASIQYINNASNFQSIHAVMISTKKWVKRSQID
jgi:hypothetical protein